MRIIISPAKKMNVNTDVFPDMGLPQFMEKTSELESYIKSLSYEECKNLWKCNDKLAELNYRRFQEMTLTKGLTPAILSYEGIQYQYMAPIVMEKASFDYLQEHLRILSGFYGMLKPFDGVTPYRLEMQAKIQYDGYKSLYEFWGNLPAGKLFEETDTIVNLASKEYSKCISQYLNADIAFVTCVFGERINGKIVEKGTYAKMARGEMVRFLAEKQVEELEGIKEFNRLDYHFSAEDSDEKNYVFLRR